MRRILFFLFQGEATRGMPKKFSRILKSETRNPRLPKNLFAGQAKFVAGPHSESGDQTITMEDTRDQEIRDQGKKLLIPDVLRS
jgi:hypothetical protein